MVSGSILKDLLRNPRDYMEFLKEIKTTPKQWVFARFAVLARNELVTGKYHSYRGLLDPHGPGPALKSIFHKSLDQLVSMGSMEESDAGQRKKNLSDDIRSVG
jgi:hypothetical protein